MTLMINDIADVINISVSNPAESEYDIFVGLEHYDVGEPIITRYGSTKMLTTACKKFSAGDILLARRNVYLRRAGLVKFDGLTSGDSIVIRIKPNLSIEGVNSQEISRLLPFVLNTNAFWDFANTNSDGTMSKRLSPQMLLSYEFNLPPYSNQKPLADKLWAAYNLKASKLKLIDAIDEMVKSQFIEMFGDLSRNTKKWPIGSLGSISDIRIGPFGSLLHQHDYCFGGHPLINPSQIVDNEIVPDSKVAISESKFKELASYALRVNDVILGRRGEMGRAGIVKQEGMLCGTGSMFIRAKEDIDSYFIHQLLINPTYKELLARNSVGTTMMNLNTTIVSSLTVPLLPAGLKKSFINTTQQADKSKFELKKSIEAIDKVIKSLINNI